MTAAALQSFDNTPSASPTFDDAAFLALLRDGLSQTPSTPEPISLVVAPDVAKAAAGDAEPPAELPPEFKLPAGWYAEEIAAPPAPLPIKAATLGFVGGIMMLLPAAIMWSNLTAPRAPSTEDLAILAQTIVSEATAHAGRLAPGPAFDQARVERIAARSLTPPAFEPHLEEARRLITAKDIASARDVLAKAAAAKSPKALFAMAETFDPNALAAWGASGVAADPARARTLYEAALNLGHDGAVGRIEALK